MEMTTQHTPDIMEKARELTIKVVRFIEDAINDQSSEDCRVVIAIGVEDIIAAALAEARAVPEGWKLVPVEPTQKMLDIGRRAYFLTVGLGAERINKAQTADYKAMIAAAPNPPIAGGG